ncbi:hypothetical protein GIB67_001117 [Kingdonia uniflora]|uniref:Alpha/beta hydrolase fold-3 domain-containing protein n=1 Tax=Kingdonia uniflora TaxID=39325 RepID=A0A7J7MH85_9MAGN|nr:hypothetical protein GIB67_001117 [Kingdonia uniflora]
MSQNPIAPVIPWSAKISLGLLSIVSYFARGCSENIHRRITNIIDFTTKIPTSPVRGLKLSDVTVDATRNIWFRLYVPTEHVDDTTCLPVIVYFHGGGFSYFSPESDAYDALCRRMARNVSAVVVSVNYRRTPEYRCPAQYDDGFDVLKFIDRGGIEGFPKNADISKCFLVGDSAGGNIAHNVARRYAENDTEFSDLKGVGLILIQPFFGGEERTDAEIRLQWAPLLSTETTDWHWKVFAP